MMLIGVTGGSGSGKSTVTKLLNEKIYNSMTIHLDEYMPKHCNAHKEEIISKLNLKIGKERWSTHLVNNYDEIKQWVNIVENDMEETVRNIISENNNSTKTVILDWAFLPLLSIYDECDFTVNVKSNFDLKLQRLSKRLEKDNKLDKWNYALDKRVKNTALEEFGHSAMYTVFNDGTQEKLEKDVNEIIEKINNK